MKNKIIHVNVEDIKPVSTSHNIGLKYVLCHADETITNIQQVAIGQFYKGESIEEHVHPTMEEQYYIMEGNLLFNIEPENFNCKRGSFIVVPAGFKHSIEAKSECKFIYWGIKI